MPAAPTKGRGRDKRSKEKALIKEALASVKQGVTEEEMEARRSRLRQLIKLGKERGFLTYAEINAHLPAGLTEVEAVYVVTPHALHAEHARTFAEDIKPALAAEWVTLAYV